MRWTATALLFLLLAGCGSPGPVVYDEPARPVRDGEKPIKARPYRDGLIIFTPIGVSTGIHTLVGSHADWPAKGQFIRIRMIIDNDYSTFHKIDLTQQLLVTTDGVEHSIDGDGTSIKRQPPETELGAHDRVELDLYYDIPATAALHELRLYGAPVTDLGIEIPHDPGVRVPLR
ncbi:MAG: DUF4352 domain-containing protein [Streptosporangiaceae bacterium]